MSSSSGYTRAASDSDELLLLAPCSPASSAAEAETFFVLRKRPPLPLARRIAWRWRDSWRYGCGGEGRRRRVREGFSPWTGQGLAQNVLGTPATAIINRNGRCPTLETVFWYTIDSPPWEDSQQLFSDVDSPRPTSVQVCHQ
uniref:Uncharacterized protein n=1 Tax=Leersia perrieri TaxID=77586 RepID=A0A0D9WVN3_9ORYZ